MFHVSGDPPEIIALARYRVYRWGDKAFLSALAASNAGRVSYPSLSYKWIASSDFQDFFKYFYD
jgi:hypothetical protein